MKRVLPILCLILCARFGASAQQCRELKDWDFAENRRFTFPAQVTGYDGTKLDVVIPMKFENRVTSFPVDSRTEFPVGFTETYRKGLWTIIYCHDSRTVLWVQKFVEAKSTDYETKEKQDKRLAKKKREKNR